MPNCTLNLQQMIREAADKKREAEGLQHGRALDHWLAAERELLAMIDTTDFEIGTGRGKNSYEN